MPQIDRGVLVLIAAMSMANAPTCVAQDAAPKKDIRISVVDATTKAPINEFRIIAGIPGGSASESFEKRTGNTVVNWQPHTLRVSKNGEFVWPADRGYDDMALRVEADGYQPARAWAKIGERPDQLKFLLVADTGVKGRVLRPGGGAAANATLALVIGHRNAYLHNGVISGSDKPLPKDPVERWRLPVFVTADAEGRFQLPTESEPAAVLVVHDSGVREISYDELRKFPDIKLERWGRVEGQVLWKDKVGSDEPVSLSSSRDAYGYPGMISAHADLCTDADGHFVFDKALPGRAQLSRITKVSDSMSVILGGMFTHIDIKAGEPTAAVIGGKGRTVAGKLIGRDAWDDVTLHFHPIAPRPADEIMWKAYSGLAKSPLGPLFFRDKLPVKADGTFTIEHMLPGRYQLFVSIAGGTGQLAYGTLDIDPEVAGQNPQPLDLGEIRVKNLAGKN